MKPEMRPGIFVFCTIPTDQSIPAALNPLLTFREQEGTTLVLLREEAEAAGLRYASIVPDHPDRSLRTRCGGLSGGDHGTSRRSRHQRERRFGVPPRSFVCADRQGGRRDGSSAGDVATREV
jgi:hypothetical protein